MEDTISHFIPHLDVQKLDLRGEGKVIISDSDIFQ